MDILETLTTDFDHLRDLTIDFALADSSGEREAIFRQLARYQDVTAKAQASILDQYEIHGEIEFSKRKMLERCDVMEEIAMSIARSNRLDIRETKMELYSDLVIQRISDSEREILPYIDEKVSEADRARMSLDYSKYRDIALDHDLNQPRAV